MTRLSSSTLVNLTHQQMLPSQPQITGKRKPEDSNPLLNAAAAKRAKKEAKLGASSKRKLNIDDGPASLLIVRAHDQPSHSQPTTTNHTDPPQPRFSSQPTTTTAAGPSKPPTKKFKADTQPAPRPRGTSQTKGSARDRVASTANYDDSEVEKDVRAMEDETDHLRRHSRAHTTIDASILAPESSVQFHSRTEPPCTARKGKGRMIDITTPLPDEDTPRIERNKQLRSGAMAAIVNGRGRTPEPTPSRSHGRRGSVGGRGKRISSSFEATGVITQPHNSVSENSFFKHIDCDLPEVERVRQLLIWCSLRGAATPTSSTSKSSSPALPPLSAEAVQALKSAQEEVVRKLAEKKIDLSLYSSASSSKSQPGNLRENEQNVRNRNWEVTYTNHIQQAQEEEEAWKKVSYGYDAYTKKLQTSLEKRSASLQADSQPSAKAKGKRRATVDVQELESSFVPLEHEVPSEFQPALTLAKSVLGYHPRGDDRIAGDSRRGLTRSGLSREEAQEEIKRRLPGLEYKADQIYSWASAARATTNIAEKMLNERFDLLSANLTSRVNPFPAGAESAAVPSSTTQLLSTYVAPPRARSAGPDPLDLMRALSRVDQDRPPAQVGDAARRAAREVQRAGESGFAGAVGGDKKLTGVPTTPRKTPGTPRRGNTPGRDR